MNSNVGSDALSASIALKSTSSAVAAQIKYAFFANSDTTFSSPKAFGYVNTDVIKIRLTLTSLNADTTNTVFGTYFGSLTGNVNKDIIYAQRKSGTNNKWWTLFDGYTTAAPAVTSNALTSNLAVSADSATNAVATNVAFASGSNTLDIEFISKVTSPDEA